jgi:dihydrolipoamide dehydrogenase
MTTFAHAGNLPPRSVRQVLVDATLVGPGTPEILHSATVAITGQVPIERLWHAV